MLSHRTYFFLFKGWIIFHYVYIPQAPSQNPRRTLGPEQMEKLRVFHKHSRTCLPLSPLRKIFLWGAFFQELSYNLKNELTSQAMSHWIRNGTQTWETPLSKVVWGMTFFIPLRMVKSCPISVGNIYSKWTNIKMGTWLGLSPVPHWSKKQLERDCLAGERDHFSSIITSHLGTSLVVQCLRLCAFNARGMDSISSQGTKTLHAPAGHSQKKKKKPSKPSNLQGNLWACLQWTSYRK